VGLEFLVRPVVEETREQEAATIAPEVGDHDSGSGQEHSLRFQAILLKIDPAEEMRQCPATLADAPFTWNGLVCKILQSPHSLIHLPAPISGTRIRCG
jgi:hypothetical protein